MTMLCKWNFKSALDKIFANKIKVQFKTHHYQIISLFCLVLKE